MAECPFFDGPDRDIVHFWPAGPTIKQEESYFFNAKIVAT